MPSPTYLLKIIGWVRKAGGRVVEVEESYLAALLGLEQYSHVWVLYWFHENDNPLDRAILQVHPYRNPANPLTGVFAAGPRGAPLTGLSVAFSPDGTTLASGSYGRTVSLWDVDVQSWIKRACTIANRNLTQEEWRRYMGDRPYRQTCPDLPLPQD